MISEQRYKIELETVEPLRIGAVKDPRSAIDNPVAKVGEKVVIPGSSLKGALRAEIEQFLIETYYDEGSQSWAEGKVVLQPCIPAPKPTTDEEGLIHSRKYRSEGCHYPCGKLPCTYRREEQKAHTICPACYFLGAMGLSGFVRVPFLYAEISPEELYSARIDRARNTVVEGTNRPYQLVPVNVKFTGNLVIITEDPVTGWKIGEPRSLNDKTLGDKWLEGGTVEAEKLIEMYIIERLRNIKILGGYKSKGFGAVKIEVTSI